MKTTYMKVSVYDLKGLKEGDLELPKVFSLPTKPRLIRRVHVALASHGYQPKGTDPIAGERTSAESWGVGRGAARMARVRGTRHPTSGRAAGVGSVVGGRIIHPPKSEKRIQKMVNRKERRLAVASALSATADKRLVGLRGHHISDVPSIPLVVSDKIEKIDTASSLRKSFEKLGLMADVLRASSGKKRRSGKAALRGRATRNPRGPLIVVAEDKGVGKAVGSFPGVECVSARNLSVINLAPGSQPGRLTVWSKSALKSIPSAVLNLGERFAA